MSGALSTGGERVRVTVILRREEFERLTRYCLKYGSKKSTLLARLLRDHLDQSDNAEAEDPQ